MAIFYERNFKDSCVCPAWFVVNPDKLLKSLELINWDEYL